MRKFRCWRDEKPAVHIGLLSITVQSTEGNNRGSSRRTWLALDAVHLLADLETRARELTVMASLRVQSPEAKRKRYSARQQCPREEV